MDNKITQKIKLPASLVKKLAAAKRGVLIPLTGEEKKLLKAFTSHAVPCLCVGNRHRIKYLRKAYTKYIAHI